MRPFLISMLAFTMFCGTAVAQVPDALAIKAIVGEAGGEGDESMVAHAHAIRNRGHLRGVYGLNAPHIASEPRWVWQKASKAWYESEWTLDPTSGADHWFSEDDLRKLGKTKPAWFGKLKKTVKVGTTTFYKEA